MFLGTHPKKWIGGDVLKRVLFVVAACSFVSFLGAPRASAADGRLSSWRAAEFDDEESLEEAEESLVELTIEVDPGADIFIDGRFIGSGESVSLLVVSGEHMIRLINDDMGIDYLTRKTIEASRRGNQVVLRYSLS